jgi:hypothetical protein
MAEQQQNPNLISKQAMSAMSSTSGTSGETVHEIFTKINNAKDKPKKMEVLKKYDTPYLRQILKAAFDPKIKFVLPEGTPPYIANEAPLGTEHSMLRNESRRLYLFIEGGDMSISRTKKETMFIQLLEGLHKTEAEVLINVKDKNLNKTYKGLTEQLVKETFDWNDDFMRNTK